MLPASTYRPTSLRLEIDSSDAEQWMSGESQSISAFFSISGAYRGPDPNGFAPPANRT